MEDLPLRILMVVSSSATSGAERHAIHLAKLLKDRGHTVEFVSPPIRWMAKLAEQSGVKSHFVDMKRNAGLHALAYLTRLVSKKKFDVVHAHLSRASYLGFASATLRGVPIVSTVHVETRDPIYRTIARRSNRIVAVSNFVRGVLMGRGVDDNYIDVVYNGTDFHDQGYTSPISVHQEFSVPLQRKMIGLVGRVCREKGHDVAVEALPQVLDENPEAQLLFVGRREGDFPDELIERTHELKIAERVTFTGNRDDVARMIDCMTLSILPSVMEACPLAALETMARGKALVASRVGGLEELVSHGETGLLVEQNAKALASGLNLLLGNQAEMDRMGVNALRAIHERFTTAQMVERLEAVYTRAARH